MIVQRYLLREVGFAFLGVALLLLLMFLSGTFVRILAEVSEGNYPAEIIFSLFGLRGVVSLVFVLPLSLYLAVMLALGRLYKDSEMIALTACGVGPAKVLSAVSLMGLVVAAIVGYLSLVLAPWAEEQGQRLIDQAGARTFLEGIVGGRFTQTESGRFLFYVEEVDHKAKTLKNVFVQGEAEGRENILTARAGFVYDDNATSDRFLVLLDGHRYEGTPGEPDYHIVDFGVHGLRIQEREVVPSKRRRNAVATRALLHSSIAADIAELQWRISMPISALLLALLAAPLSKTTPRQGRYGKLFAGLMIYLIYNNLLTVARSSLAKGTTPPEVGLWWVHGVMLATVLFLVWYQRSMPGPRPAKGRGA